MVDFADEDLKAVTTDMFKELYELVSKELKESIVTILVEINYNKIEFFL